VEDVVTQDVASKQVPLVSYLVLADGDSHLLGNACDDCGAVFLGRRNACGHCGGRDFHARRLASTGRVTSFTIVSRAAPGVPVPFVSAVVQLEDGVSVLANIVGVEPDPEHVHLGMPVRLTTYVAGTDDDGVQAVAFGFAPAD
jgi:uncharacterized OB-fold protein